MNKTSLSSKSELLEALEALRSVHVLVVGDLILDRYVWSTVDRISPEAPVPVCLVNKTEDRLGGAANVCRNLRGLGVEVTICGIIGDDEEGRQALSLLTVDGIHKQGVLVDNMRPTIAKTRVIAQSQQLLRIDREDVSTKSTQISAAFSAIVDAQLTSLKADQNKRTAVIISDYGKGAYTESLAGNLTRAYAEGRLGRESCPLMIDPHPKNYSLYKGSTVVKPNRKEAEAATGIKINSRESAEAAARKIIDIWQTEIVVLSLGADGLMIIDKSRKDPVVRPTLAKQVFDVSGAGDTVVSVFTAALAAGVSIPVAGDLANISAGIVVSEIGTAAINADKLLEEINALG